MRAAKFSILLLASLVLGVVASTAQTTLSTNNVIFNFGNIVPSMPSGRIKSVSIATVQPLIQNGVAYSTAPATLNLANDAVQITNGYAIFTNLLCGPACVVTISDGWSTVTTNFTISPPLLYDANGNVNALYYIGPYVRGIGQFYAFRNTTNYTYNIQGGGVYWNTTATTNGMSAAKFVWVPATPPFNSTNYPHGIIFTN